MILSHFSVGVRNASSRQDRTDRIDRLLTAPLKTYRGVSGKLCSRAECFDKALDQLQAAIDSRYYIQPGAVWQKCSPKGARDPISIFWHGTVATLFAHPPILAGSVRVSGYRYLNQPRGDAARILPVARQLLSPGGN